MMQIAFSDQLVTYDKFLNDVAARVAALIQKDASDPTYISQRKAYAMFGRANVDRWFRQGKVHPARRPGKIEYPVAELRLLQRIKNDQL